MNSVCYLGSERKIFLNAFDLTGKDQGRSSAKTSQLLRRKIYKIKIQRHRCPGFLPQVVATRVEGERHMQNQPRGLGRAESPAHLDQRDQVGQKHSLRETSEAV